MKIYIVLITASIILLFTTVSAVANEPAGTANSRPNVSGGYDFYDAEGNKTGSSQALPDGGYIYYDKYGNMTGKLTPGEEGEGYRYYDEENVERGAIATDPYGGYRYNEKAEGLVTPSQTQVRRNYDYTDAYGDGIGTLPPEVIEGKE